MGMTMTQKILAAHAGEASVKAGQLIQAKLDIVMGNDITTAVALKEFQKTGAKEVFDKDKVVITLPPTRTSRRQSSARPAVPLLMIWK